MVDVSTLFELLADDRRRQILFRLCRSESVRIPEDVGREGESPTARSPTPVAGRPVSQESSPPSLAVELHHRHLPKLEDADVVHWDREAGTVTRGPAFASVEPLLQLIADNADLFPEA